MKTWKADLALVGNTVIWGVTFVLVKDALNDVSPMVYLALRFALAAVVLALIYRRRLQRSSLKNGAIAGVFLFLGYLFQTTGLQFTTPSKSAFYTSLSIPLVPLLGSIVYRKTPRWIEVAGIIIATAGMLLLTAEGSRLVWDRGSLLSLLCAVSFAAHIVTIGYFAETSSFETIAVAQVATATLLAAVCIPLFGHARLKFSPTVIIAVLVTALFATALAFSLQAWAQQHTTASRTALIFTLEPVWAWITSWVVTGEKLSKAGALGGLLILAGVLLVEVKREGSPEHPSIRSLNPEV